MGLLRDFKRWREQRREAKEKWQRDYSAIHDLWLIAGEMPQSEFLLAMDELHLMGVDWDAHTSGDDLLFAESTYRENDA
ncbi:MAG: hypothetical protein ABJN62_09770 [Halioglobus sp.]